MRAGAFISASLHVFVITLAYFGLPALFDSAPTPVQPIYVELVSLADQPVEKKTAPKPKPKPKPKAKLRPPPPPPAPPPPPPEAEPVPVAKPKPAPKPEVKVKPKPIPKPKPKKIVPKKVKLAKATPKPRRKPTPPRRVDPMKSLLRDIQNQPTPKKDVVRKKPKKDELREMLAAVTSPPTPKPAIMSSIDRRREGRALAQLVLRQVKPCWNPTSGGKGAHTMRVGIRIFLHRNGTFSRQPIVEDMARMARDAAFRAFAESALRALRDPRCYPLRLPVKQYAVWRDISFNFNPRELLR